MEKGILTFIHHLHIFTYARSTKQSKVKKVFCNDLSSIFNNLSPFYRNEFFYFLSTTFTLTTSTELFCVSLHRLLWRFQSQRRWRRRRRPNSCTLRNSRPGMRSPTRTNERSSLQRSDGLNHFKPRSKDFSGNQNFRNSSSWPSQNGLAGERVGWWQFHNTSDFRGPNYLKIKLVEFLFQKIKTSFADVARLSALSPMPTSAQTVASSSSSSSSRGLQALARVCVHGPA